MYRVEHWTGLLAVLGFSLYLSSAVASELPRRGTLGLATTSAESGAVVVSRVYDGGPAARAGLKVADALLRIGTQDIKTTQDAAAALASLKSGRAIEVRVNRDGMPVDAVVMPDALPRETLDGARLIYDDVKLGAGVRIRTIASIPQASGPLTKAGRVPGVVFIPAASCTTIETLANANHPYSRLVRRLTESGFAVLRVEKPGIGDSEGVACRESGFVQEMAAYFMALDQFKRRAQVDEDRLFAIGISVGGMQAPLLAQGHELKGIVTFGTVVQPWFDYIVTNFRSRWLAQGISPSDVDKHMRHVRMYFARLLIMGETPEQITRAMPKTVAAARSLLGQDLEHFSGRHYTYHQQIDRQNIYGAWASFNGALLSVHGEYDWVSSLEDHKSAAMIVSGKGDNRAEFNIIKGMGHGFTLHDNLAGSFAKPFNGKPSNAFHDLTVEWLVKKAGGTP